MPTNSQGTVQLAAPHLFLTHYLLTPTQQYMEANPQLFVSILRSVVELDH